MTTVNFGLTRHERGPRVATGPVDVGTSIQTLFADAVEVRHGLRAAERRQGGQGYTYCGRDYHEPLATTPPRRDRDLSMVSSKRSILSFRAPLTTQDRQLLTWWSPAWVLLCALTKVSYQRVHLLCRELALENDQQTN